MWCCWASKHQHGNTDHRSPRTSSHINCCMTSSGEGVRCCAAELPPLLLSWTNLARKLPAPHCASNEEHCHQRCSASCCTAEMGKQKWSMGPINSPACNPAFAKLVAARSRREESCKTNGLPHFRYEIIWNEQNKMHLAQQLRGNLQCTST